MSDKLPKNHPTNEENSTLDTLLGREEELIHQMLTGPNAEFLDVSHRLGAIQRERGLLEAQIFGGEK